MRYTKGPWETTYDAVTQSWEINQGYPHGINAGIRIRKATNQSINEQKGNAFLIASAPDLYEALDFALLTIKARLNNRKDLFTDDEIAKLEQAIRKADQH